MWELICTVIDCEKQGIPQSIGFQEWYCCESCGALYQKPSE